MVVPKGYKQTEVGVIPEDWEVISIFDTGTILNGLTYSPNNIKPYGLLVLRSSNVQNSRLAFDDNVYVDCKVSQEKYVRENDLLICVRNGSRALIGKCAKIDKNYNATFGAFMSLIRSAMGEYLFQVFQSNIIQEQIDKNCSATINQITKNDFKHFFIPLPSLPEKKVIATALSDVDSLITSLEKLIDKKRNIKQGTMQELLTGKKRLDGFCGEFVEKTIGDICNVKKGSMITENHIQKGYVPVIAGGKQPAYYHNKSNRKSNTITISASGASAGYVAFYKQPIFASDCSTIEGSNIINIKFIYYSLLLKQNELTFMQTGGAQPHINPNQIKSISIYFTGLEEQTAIANILSDIDNEIEALEKKLSKYKQIKQGMMQQLLTGKIRLV